VHLAARHAQRGPTVAGEDAVAGGALLGAFGAGVRSARVVCTEGSGVSMGGADGTTGEGATEEAAFQENQVLRRSASGKEGTCGGGGDCQLGGAMRWKEASPRVAGRPGC
jgi:hypothetical protein